MPKKLTRTQRTVGFARRHPWLTWSTLSTIVGLLPVLGAIAAWGFGFLETSAQAKALEDRLRSETAAHVALIYGELNKLKASVEARWASDDRSSAGMFLQLLENRVIVARNKINDCNILREKKMMMTPMEMSSCFQYESNYAEAKRRWENQQSSAMQTWRGK